MTRTSGAPTLGVEEEFFVVDGSGRLSRHGAELAGEADEHDGELQQELNRCQVKSATEVLTQLEELRGGLAVAAARRGARILPSGTPVMPEDGPADVTPSPRYERMAHHFGATLRGVTTCGASRARRGPGS